MIESITLKNVATFDNEGVIIDKLQKINLIYGANAMGKTTLSNYIQAIQEFPKTHSVNNDLYKDCSISWKNDSQLECFVYNKTFKEEYFSADDLPGIFTLGKASKEQKDKIIKLNDEFNQIISQHTTYLKSKNDIEKGRETLISNFQNKVWLQIFKIYDADFYEAFSGMRNSKEKFKERLIHENNTNNSELHSLEDLQQRAKTIFGNAPTKLETITLIDSNLINNIENAVEWKQKIIGAADVDIAKLIHRLNIDDWVNQGRIHIQEESDVCPFCQQHTITEDFKRQLNAYFGETFTEKIASVKRFEELYMQNTQLIILNLNEILNREKENIQSKLDINSLQKYIELLNTSFRNNLTTIDAKRKEPSRSLDLISTKEIIDNINSIIGILMQMKR